MPTSEVIDRRDRLSLVQHADDLLFVKLCFLHLVRLSIRTGLQALVEENQVIVS